MTVLDLLFEEVDATEENFSKVLNYDYWSINFEGKYLFSKTELDNSMFEEGIRLEIYTISESIHDITFIADKPVFIPYEELEFLSKIDIEIIGKDKIDFNNWQKYPLCCVRGTCSKPCEKKPEANLYCFRELPCMNNRPDWNCWSAKYPEFGDFFFDVAEFVMRCPNTDTFIVMFEYTPSYAEKELDFEYVLSAVLVKGTKITFITDLDKIKKLYEEYNTKYPTEDRHIEKSISYPERDFIFKF